MMGSLRVASTRATNKPAFPAITIATVAVALLFPGAASATNYADPAGSGSICSETSPCSIGTAFQSALADEDIRLYGGTYELGGGRVDAFRGNDVYPDDVDDPVMITASSQGFGPSVSIDGPGASIRDVSIIGTTGGTMLSLSGDGAPLAARVYVENGGTSGSGCSVSGGVMRDSVCRGSGAGSDGFSDGLEVVRGASGTADPTLRNVTAYSDNGSGIYMLASNGGSVDLDARNVIADSGAGQDDIQAFGGPIDADIDFSNFGSVGTAGSDITISAAGSASNQTAEPAFVDAAGDNFRQASSSPTIDAGTEAASDLGTDDLDGNARVQGETIDIGAYEDLADLYASPGGAGTAACSATDPCDVTTAAGRVVEGQDIKLDGGTYDIGDDIVGLGDDNDISPIDPTETTELEFGDGYLSLAGGSSASDLAITAAHDDDSPLRSIGSLSLDDASAERIEAVSSTDWGCALSGDSSLTDSVCRTTADAGALSIDTGFDDTDATLRNVTALGAFSGLDIRATSGRTASLVARNSIFYATAPDFTDVRAAAGDGQQTAVDADIDYSNFGDVTEVRGQGSAVSVDAAGSRNNQTATPRFIDLASGDLHQRDDSPTIDAGDSSASGLGTLDLDRDQRVQGDSVDIGAYETFIQPDTSAPIVEITKSPAKKTRSRVARFRFTASDDSADSIAFLCKLDRRQPRPCTSPIAYRNLKPGRHSFTVTATDTADNSATDRYAWRVVKRKRKGG